MERTPVRAPLARSVMLGLCMMGLIGCGGGGGGGNVRNDPPPPAPSTPNPPTPPTTPSVPPPPPTPARSLVTERFAHWRVINHGGGFDMGTDGVLGVVSTGVRGDSAELAGQPVRQFTYVDAASNDLGVADKAGVGTDLARVLSERPAGLETTAITLANGADIVSARLVPDASVDAVLSDSQAAPSRLRTMHEDLMSAGVSVMLNAWGSTSWNDAATTDAYVSAYRPFVVDHDGLVIFAAGDGAGAQPSGVAALPSRSAGAAVLESGWLTVAALDTLVPTRLAPYANACGDTARFCMVAPGDLALAGSAGDPAATRSVNGSAFAAAQVAGAAASVRELFPYMSASQVQQVLLGNAVDLGPPGVDATFGWGLLDFDHSIRGPAKLLWGDFEVVIPANMTSVWWNDMSGPANVIVGSDDDAVDGLDDASLHIDGNNTFTGSLRIKSGLTVSINGTMTAPITIDDGAYLYAWEVTVRAPLTNRGVLQISTGSAGPVHTFFEGDVTNEGILVNREGESAVLLGNLFLKPSGTFMVNALGNDPLRVKGRIEIDGDLYISRLAEGYVARSRTEILVGEGGITGQFAHAYSGPLIDATIGYDANTVWLDVDRIDARSVQGLAYSPGSFSAAQRVEHAFGLLDEILLSPSATQPPTAFATAAARLQGSASAAVVQRSLDSLSGELHDADGAFAMMATEGNRRSLESRLDALQDGQAPGAWSRQQDGQRGWSSFDVSTNGWLLGFDQRGSDGVTVGASLSETSGDAWHSQRFDRERNRQVDGQVYASWNLGEGAFVLGSAGFGHMQRWLQREVLLGDEAYRVSSDYAHRYGALSLQTGRRMPFGRASLTPYVGAQALRLDRDGFSEEGASGFGLTSDDASMSALQALVGARWNHAWNGDATRWSLSGRVEWQHLLSQSGTQIQARFTGMDAWAPIVADGMDRNVGLFGLGLAAGIGRRNSLRFDLDSRYSDGEQWTGAMATWSTAF